MKRTEAGRPRRVPDTTWVRAPLMKLSGTPTIPQPAGSIDWTGVRGRKLATSRTDAGSVTFFEGLDPWQRPLTTVGHWVVRPAVPPPPELLPGVRPSTHRSTPVPLLLPPSRHTPTVIWTAVHDSATAGAPAPVVTTSATTNAATARTTRCLPTFRPRQQRTFPRAELRKRIDAETPVRRGGQSRHRRQPLCPLTRCTRAPFLH